MLLISSCWANISWTIYAFGSSSSKGSEGKRGLSRRKQGFVTLERVFGHRKCGPFDEYPHCQETHPYSMVRFVPLWSWRLSFRVGLSLAILNPRRFPILWGGCRKHSGTFRHVRLNPSADQGVERRKFSMCPSFGRWHISNQLNFEVQLLAQDITLLNHSQIHGKTRSGNSEQEDC